MTFVYPFLLGGLLLAGLPVVLHFLIRKKPKSLPFPAFRFLMQKQRSNTRNLRLRHLLLLLLRIVLLVLLCLALARPRLFQEQLGMISRERPIAVVLVFDTSPSMEYKRDDMTRLDLAKKRGLELLDQLADGCRIVVVDSGESKRGDWTQSIEKARQRVSGLTIRHNNEPVTRTIDEAMRRFDKLDEAAVDLPRFVCIFSDRTKSSWEAGARPASSPAKQLFFDVGVDEPIDLAITHVELARSYRGEMRQSFAEGEKIAVRVVVKATGKDHQGDLICKIGARELRQTIPLIATGEQQTLAFEIDSGDWGLRPGFHQAEIKLDAATDALAFNNQRFVTLKIREQTPVLVLADNKKAERLKSRFEALLYQVDVQPATADVVLGNYAAVFLDGVAAPPDKLWQTLAAYVEKGGGVGIIPAGDNLDRAAYNNETARHVMPATIARKITVANGKAIGWADEFLHPFMQPYGAWVEDGSSDFLRYPREAYHYWELKDPATVVVHYQDRRPAIVERLGKGRVLLLSTPLEEQKVEWTNYHESHTSFRVALPYLCVRHLVNEPVNPHVNFQFGGEPPSAQAPLVESPKYLLTGPELTEEIRFDLGRWVGDRLPRAGNYSLAGTNADKTDPKVFTQFSINIPGEESDLSRISVSEIEAVFGTGAVVPQDRRRSLVDSLNWNEPIELFPWLMLALLLFLAIENLLANRFYRVDA